MIIGFKLCYFLQSPDEYQPHNQRWCEACCLSSDSFSETLNDIVSKFAVLKPSFAILREKTYSNLIFDFCPVVPRMREDMTTMVCMKEEEDPGEKLSQDEIISKTKQVIQGLEALKQEHHSILEGLLGTLRCLKQDEEGVLVEEKSHMIRKSLEMLELGLSEAQVHINI